MFRLIALAAFALLSMLAFESALKAQVSLGFQPCENPTVIDGDTIRCSNFPESIRLAAIDAPDRSCRGRSSTNCRTRTVEGRDYYEARAYMRRMMSYRPVTVRFYAGRSYGRRIAVVCVRNTNLNDHLIRRGFARYMPRWNGAGRRVHCPT